MSDLDRNTSVKVPLWALLASGGGLVATAFGWLVTRFLDLQAQIIDLHEIIRELTNATGI